MKKYHKIQTVFKRDPETKFKTLLLGDYSIPEFGYLANCNWVFTEKVDGTNIRVGFENGKVLFGGRTDSAQIPATLVQRLEEIFLPQQEVFTDVFSDADVCLYGEGYGPKIQKGGSNYRSDQSFVLFDIRVGNTWLKREDVEDVALKLHIDVVPIVGCGTLHDMIDRVSHGVTSEWGNFQAEGYVARPEVELCDRMGQRIITKLKCKDFA